MTHSMALDELMGNEYIPHTHTHERDCLNMPLFLDGDLCLVVKPILGSLGVINFRWRNMFAMEG